MEQQQLATAGLMGLLAGLGMGIMLFILAIAVFTIICHWKIYAKAGEPGWACLVPIYNIIVWLKIINKPWWWLLLLIIPIVNIVILNIMIHRLALSFGKGAGFTLGLLFVNVIFYAILAFDKSTYTKLEK